MKSEAPIIERMLSSVAPYIDCAVILDTGSTDDTQKIMTAFFQSRGIPWEMHDTKFKNFSQARN
ncbi:MAG TPA: hypothetical protein VMQ59_02720, partial [Acidimicrobiales bacterium]|nr:hypothetical protein [Acidimicrobiales bacterium]